MKDTKATELLKEVEESLRLLQTLLLEVAVAPAASGVAAPEHSLH